MHAILRMTAIAACSLASSCSKETAGVDERDTRWAYQATLTCPAVKPIYDKAIEKGRLSVADLERMHGAIEIVRGNPVKDQRCDVMFDTPTSTRDVVIDDGYTLIPDGNGQVQMQPDFKTIKATE